MIKLIDFHGKVIKTAPEFPEGPEDIILFQGRYFAFSQMEEKHTIYRESKIQEIKE